MNGEINWTNLQTEDDDLLKEYINMWDKVVK